MSSSGSDAGTPVGSKPATAGLSGSQRRLLEERLRGAGRAPSKPVRVIPRRTRERLLLASLGQQGVFAAHQADPGSPSFNITSSFRVDGRLDVARLEGAVQRVVERHEVLRSNYRLIEEGVALLIRDELPVPIEVVPCVDHAEALSKAEERVRRPFDLEHDALLRLFYLEPEHGDAVLSLSVHDIVFDKWSLGRFWQEVAICYRQASGDTTAVLPAVEVQYADFSEWQRSELLPDGLTRQLDYWRHQLADPPEPIALPTDRPYPTRLTDAGRLAHHSLSPSLTGQLKTLAAGEDASLFMLLLLAFQLLMHRYAETRDLVVASPIANRRHRETTDLIGFFLSTVALRARIDDRATLRDALRKTRAMVLGAIENQDSPFDRVVDAVRPPRVPGRHPLCQLMFVYQREHEGAPSFDLGEVQLRHIYVETRTAKYDLTLFAAESGDGLETVLEYRTDLFDAETMERLLRHYEVLLAEIVAHADAPISRLGFLTSAERRQLLVDWQGESSAVDALPGVIEQIAAHVEASSETPAVLVSGLGTSGLGTSGLGASGLGASGLGASGGSWSYAELGRAADAVARRLRAIGVQPGQNVALFLHRSPEAIAGILGILRAGAAYVPLDPDYPRERRDLVLRDAEITIAVTSEALRGELRDSALDGPVRETVVVDAKASTADSADPLSTGAALAAASVSLDQPAYTIYTSGSTGRPKGVVVSHRNLLHSTAARKRYYGAPPSRFLLIPSLSFDSSVAGLFWTLAEGGGLVVASAEEQRDPDLLCRLIAEHQVTDLLCIPTLYREILAQADGRLATLRRAIVAGESCPSDLVQQHTELLPEAELFNEYGPTEATVWATVHRCETADVSRPVPIGRPVPNTQVYLLDSEQRLVPIGVPGELYVGGGGVADGYWRNPELTSERFVTVELPDVELPDVELPTEAKTRDAGSAQSVRLYATGDLARWRRDGTIDFLGRRDGQVKVRGYRIELGEVEAALRESAAVAEAVATTQRSGGDRPLARLVAYIVTTVAAPLDVDELKRALAQQLPAYAVPHAIVVLDELPRLPNGKVDRGGLPQLDTASQKAATGTVASTDAERTLLAIWREVLGLDAVALEDDFFALGGDSLMSIQIVSRARAAGLQLAPRDLADYPTLEELAAQVSLTAASGIAASGAAASGVGRTADEPEATTAGPIPLTPIQRWFFERRLARPEHWNQAMAIELPNSVESSQVETIVAGLFDQHAQLRAGFRESGGEWVQDVPQQVPARYESELFVQFGAETGGSLEAVVSRLQKTFRFDGSPLVRFALVGDSDRRLVVVAHHLVIDAVSWQILIDDLAAACQAVGGAIGTSREIAWPPSTDSFAHWARRLNRLDLDDELERWAAPNNGELGRLPIDHERPTELPEKRPEKLDRKLDGELVESDAETVEVELSRTLSERLFQDSLEAYNSKVEDLLITALALALSDWTRAREFRVGLERHGRDALNAIAQDASNRDASNGDGSERAVDVSRTVGWFTSAFPLRIALPEPVAAVDEAAGAGTLGAAIKSIKEALRTIPHSGIGYGLLRYGGDPAVRDRLSADEASEDVLFNYLGSVVSADTGALQAEPLFGGTRAAENQRSHLLEINCRRENGQLKMAWIFNRRAHDRATIERWSNDYLVQLEQIVSHCVSADAGGYTPSDFPDAGLDQQELDDLLDGL